MAKKSRINMSTIIKHDHYYKYIATHITMELINSLAETQPYLANIP